MPKADSDYACLAVINVDSGFKKEEIYSPQVFLKEWKYIEKEVIRHITEDPEISSDESDEEKVGVIKFFQRERYKQFVVQTKKGHDVFL